MKKKYLTLEQICSEIQGLIDRGEEVNAYYENGGHWYVSLTIFEGKVILCGVYICCDDENSCGNNERVGCRTVGELKEYFNDFNDGWRRLCD